MSLLQEALSCIPDFSKNLLFSEECVICIEQLEKFLWQTRMSMADSAILCDTNVFAKEINKHWQYPPKRIWTVVKADIYKTLSFS